MNKQNYHKVLQTCRNHGAQLVAVSKTRSIAEIKGMYDEGQRIFGENRVQELMEKYDKLPGDIAWHLIGHLQSNKVKYIAPFVAMIHSVDSLSLLQEINKQAQKNNKVIPVLLQFHIADEESKFGLDEIEADKLIASDEYKMMQNIQIAGVMGMATFTDNEMQIRNEFKHLSTIFNNLKNKYFSTDESFREISMGMSGDYEIALEEGSTLVRVGSLIF